MRPVFEAPRNRLIIRFIMQTKFCWQSAFRAAGMAVGIAPIAAAQPPQSMAQIAEARKTLEQELESVAIVERKVMVPMRDGKRMAADIYRPKDTSKKYPIIFVRTPYNFNYWDVRTARRAT